MQKMFLVHLQLSTGFNTNKNCPKTKKSCPVLASLCGHIQMMVVTNQES